MCHFLDANPTKEKYGIIYFENDKHHFCIEEFPIDTNEAKIIVATNQAHPQGVYKESRKMSESFNKKKLKRRVKWLDDHYVEIVKPRQKRNH